MRLALIIGNSKYNDSTLQSLITPSHDAESLSKVLSDSNIGKFEVKTLINRPLSEILQEIEVFFSNSKREDLLLVYFSGHGIKDSAGRLFLAARETMRDRLRSTSIPASFLHETMEESRAKQQILILDCCHSGAFPKGMQHKGTERVGIEDQFKSGRGRIVLTASNAIQYAFEGDQIRSLGKSKQSVFTKHLIKGIETGEADRDHNGVISLNELYDYIHNAVVHEIPQQTPEIWQFGVEGEIILAFNPKSTTSPSSSTSKIINGSPTDFASLGKLLFQAARQSPHYLIVFTYLIVIITYIIFKGNINSCEEIFLLSNPDLMCSGVEKFSLITACYWGIFAAVPNFATSFSMHKTRLTELAALFSSFAFMFGAYFYYLVFTGYQAQTNDFSTTVLRYFGLVALLGLMWSAPPIWMFLNAKNVRILLLLPCSIIGIAIWNLYLILPMLDMYRTLLAITWGAWSTMWLILLIPPKTLKQSTST